ncbi:unnamed protein product [Didymodactylos carnosus]|uniref:Uncharacterized protein n=1 Tax=Didymodactylos carnosus TaxID=1234261 RepID=A0A815RSB9_9BILA|nr:unnamed protein product [Didymodactylos carnosus]CAF1481155.1 unnamed protein product [Didymodactylos carnosus]CAF4017916.1 unnamed protein product [Didymodactylos carnosus]CAF4346277.1 unnamed protein product [Didymodactylos carnosus]
MSGNRSYNNDSNAALRNDGDDGHHARLSDYPSVQQKQHREADRMGATRSSQYTGQQQLSHHHLGHQQMPQCAPHSSTNDDRDRLISRSHQTAAAVGSSSPLIWKYTVTNDVQSLYNTEEAKSYTQEVANIWQLQRYQNGIDFVATLMRAIDQREKPEVAYDYLYTNERGEDFYILVIIRKTADSVDVCYSYQSITMEERKAAGGILLSERKSVSWLKQTAIKNLNAHTHILKSFTEGSPNEQSRVRGGAAAVSMSGYDPQATACQRGSKK